MHDDIVIIRDGNTYRVLFGHLRLSSLLNERKEVQVGVKGEGAAKVVKCATGLFVDNQVQLLPLHQL